MCFEKWFWRRLFQYSIGRKLREETVEMRLISGVRYGLLGLMVFFSIFLVSSCVARSSAVHNEENTEAALKGVETEKAAASEAGSEKVASAPKAEEVPADTQPADTADSGDIYATIPKPLTAVQCGQCHESIYMKLRSNGGKHKFVCRNCHKEFHNYNPVRKNWNEIMPKCARCHNQPHGPGITACLKCHQEPHTPLVIPYNSYVTSRCGKCHPGPAGQLKKYPSKHTKLGCAKCHDKHGYIPSCFKCHKPHIPNQSLEACKSCHPVHKPLQITYGTGNAKTCSTCHKKVYNEWSHTRSKHGKVDCAQCHPKHGEIPKCSKCHGQPHDKAMLQHFKRCLDCHLNVHDLPTG